MILEIRTLCVFATARGCLKGVIRTFDEKMRKPYLLRIFFQISQMITGEVNLDAHELPSTGHRAFA